MRNRILQALVLPLAVPLSVCAVCFSAAQARAQTIPGAVPARREPHHHMVYEDAVLRVLRVQVPAHDTTLLHEHAADYFWIALGASEVVNAKLGAPDAVIASADLSIHYTPGKFAHVARNPGSTPFDNITVELLGAQTNVHNLCAPAMAAQPMDCATATTARDNYFSGAEELPAFSTDQLRVSLVTMAPGVVLHPGAKSARATVIALDTNDTRGALRIGGAARWVGGVFRSSGASPWSIANTGKAPVRVLTVVLR